MMVSIRELKDKLSEHLRRVQSGERLTITDHGRPVAELLPLNFEQLSPEERLERLVTSGEVSPGKGRPWASVTPSVIRGKPASETILEERR